MSYTFISKQLTLILVAFLSVWLSL